MAILCLQPPYEAVMVAITAIPYLQTYKHLSNPNALDFISYFCKHSGLTNTFAVVDCAVVTACNFAVIQDEEASFIFGLKQEYS